MTPDTYDMHTLSSS